MDYVMSYDMLKEAKLKRQYITKRTVPYGTDQYCVVQYSTGTSTLREPVILPCQPPSRHTILRNHIPYGS